MLIDLKSIASLLENCGVKAFIVLLEFLHRYFKETSNDLIKRALKSKIKLSDAMLPSYKGLTHDSIQSTEQYHLSERQIECLCYLMKGMSMKQIAKCLSLSPRTIEYHLDAVKIKLNCHSRVEMFKKASRLEAIRKKADML